MQKNENMLRISTHQANTKNHEVSSTPVRTAFVKRNLKMANADDGMEKEFLNTL